MEALQVTDDSGGIVEYRFIATHSYDDEGLSSDWQTENIYTVRVSWGFPPSPPGILWRVQARDEFGNETILSPGVWVPPGITQNP
jgi:hypothetical protein